MGHAGAALRSEAEAALIPVGTTAIAARANVTAESLIDEAEQVRVGAMRSHQYGAANGAVKVKSVLSGKWIERAEIGSPGEFDAMSDAELLTALRERFSRLDSEARLAISDGSITLKGGRDDE